MEGCEKKCTTPQKRRLHLIDKHMYPKNFFFALTKEGIDGRDSLLLEAGHRRRKPPTRSQPQESKRQGDASPESSEVRGYRGDAHQGSGSGARDPPETPMSEQDTGPPPKEDNDDAMEGLTGAMSALKFIPRNVRFGRGGKSTGFSKN